MTQPYLGLVGWWCNGLGIFQDFWRCFIVILPSIYIDIQKGRAVSWPFAAWKSETRSRNLFGKLLGHLHSAKERPATCHVASVFGRFLRSCKVVSMLCFLVVDGVLAQILGTLIIITYLLAWSKNHSCGRSGRCSCVILYAAPQLFCWPLTGCRKKRPARLLNCGKKL